MSVAGAALAVAVVLVGVTAVAWFVARAEDAPAVARDYLPALADWALVALAVRTLALLVSGSTSPAAYGLTIVLACAAAWCRQPQASPEAATEPATSPAASAPVAAGGVVASAPVAAGGVVASAPVAADAVVASAAATHVRRGGGGSDGSLWARQRAAE